MDLQILWDALLALVPPLAVGFLFYVIMRGILRADATERRVYAEMETQMRADLAKQSEGQAKQSEGQAKQVKESKN